MGKGLSLNKGHSIWKWKMDKETFENKKNKELTKKLVDKFTDRLNVGDKVNKPKGYKFPGVIISKFYTTKGELRYVVEMEDYGLLHIFNEEQLELQ